MSNPSTSPNYPIAAVSKLTGVNCHTLRVWERRYGFPVPHRSPSGHRRYDPEQVRRIQQLLELAHTGRPMGELIAEMLAGRIELGPASEAECAADSGRIDPDLAALMDCLAHDRRDEADACFDRLERRWGVESLVVHLIVPALVETGERWFRRSYSIYQERCVSVYLRRKLDVMIDEARKANTKPQYSVIVGTMQGDRHEGGLLVANLFLERCGWRVTNLGADLPVAEYAQAVEQLRPDALALSFVLSRNVNKRFKELVAVRGLPIFVGGRGILNYQGLARRHGLIPIPGNIHEAIQVMTREFESRKRLAAAQGAPCPDSSRIAQ